ncbi:neutral zinc metallopeptidase [Mannheimia sp. AT1]|uniref:Neutral zinc metallopeptidase n=1 Tax=Mannheimia cairinae TaxID=3025936 RepID=A0ABT5MRM2_9PAST|nr:neutral zinc metallopeptidase [Mannheimia cairinae]MDD0824836.1 neutral zinc metallopeptidase [Mannheimia cairinae]MDD0826234.1 neutral zinc metallopeptidase [Mannheimia cairinae]
MKLDDLRRSKNVEDRRAKSGPSVGRGKGGILTFIIVLVGAYYGVDLSGLMSGGGDSYQHNTSSLNSQEEAKLEDLSSKVLASTEDIWGAYFKQNGMSYKHPTLVLYRNITPTACGTGQSAMGPFYCPVDQKVYLDLSFYDDMRKQLKASGEFAFSYVIAHEVGHHVQNLLGITAKTQSAQMRAGTKIAANQISVNVELQADCFAGVWGHQFAKEGRLTNNDIEDAFNAAQAVGDDRLQQQSQGYVVPDSFTHGSSAERLAWFKKGLTSGNPAVCDTF